MCENFLASNSAPLNPIKLKMDVVVEIAYRPYKDEAGRHLICGRIRAA